ncbi:hypothetical protein SEVIR_9G339801v4 [Setaria viridis]
MSPLPRRPSRLHRTPVPKLPPLGSTSCGAGRAWIGPPPPPPTPHPPLPPPRRLTTTRRLHRLSCCLCPGEPPAAVSPPRSRVDVAGSPPRRSTPQLIRRRGSQTPRSPSRGAPCAAPAGGGGGGGEGHPLPRRSSTVNPLIGPRGGWCGGRGCWLRCGGGLRWRRTRAAVRRTWDLGAAVELREEVVHRQRRG